MNQDFPFEHFLSAGSDSILKTQVKSPPAQKESKKNIEEDLKDLLNHEVHNYLKTVVSEEKYNLYFQENFNLIEISEQTAKFQAKTAFIKKIAENFSNEISNSILNTIGKKLDIEIEVENTFNSGLNESNKQQVIKSVKDVKFSLDLNPTRDDVLSKIESQYLDHVKPDKTLINIDTNKTFENFIVGPSNNMAFATAKAVAQTPGKSGKYPTLYIHSNSGLGKTHLLHAVANEVRELHPQLVIKMITARDFMTEMVDYIKENKITEFVRKYTEIVDVLMIDDIHELKNKQRTQDEFFHVFNELHNKGKQLIFTSDKLPKEIDGIDERIKTRLQWGLVVDIQAPDLETRIAILKKKAEDLDLYIPEDIITLMAASIKSSIRELEGSLMSVSAYCSLNKSEIDVELVKNLLNLNSPTESRALDIETIAKVCAQYFNVPLADLKSKSRSQEITKARHIAMYLCRKVLAAKQQEIGLYFGGRDHSSVIHAIDTISSKIKVDQSLSRDVYSIENHF